MNVVSLIGNLATDVELKPLARDAAWRASSSRSIARVATVPISFA
jgi:hypothetical protein